MTTPSFSTRSSLYPPVAASGGAVSGKGCPEALGVFLYDAVVCTLLEDGCVMGIVDFAADGFALMIFCLWGWVPRGPRCGTEELSSSVTEAADTTEDGGSGYVDETGDAGVVMVGPGSECNDATTSWGPTTLGRPAPLEDPGESVAVECLEDGTAVFVSTSPS